MPTYISPPVSAPSASPRRRRRRAVSARWHVDGVRHCVRPCETSPPFSDVAREVDAVIREDWFPMLWRASRCRARSPHAAEPEATALSRLDRRCDPGLAAAYYRADATPTGSQSHARYSPRCAGAQPGSPGHEARHERRPTERTRSRPVPPRNARRHLSPIGPRVKLQVRKGRANDYITLRR